MQFAIFILKTFKKFSGKLSILPKSGNDAYSRGAGESCFLRHYDTMRTKSICDLRLNCQDIMILLLHKEQQEIVDLVWDLDICQIKFYLHR